MLNVRATAACLVSTLLAGCADESVNATQFAAKLKALDAHLRTTEILDGKEGGLRVSCRRDDAENPFVLLGQVDVAFYRSVGYARGAALIRGEQDPIFLYRNAVGHGEGGAGGCYDYVSRLLRGETSPTAESGRIRRGIDVLCKETLPVPDGNVSVAKSSLPAAVHGLVSVFTSDVFDQVDRLRAGTRALGFENYPCPAVDQHPLLPEFRLPVADAAAVRAYTRSEQARAIEVTAYPDRLLLGQQVLLDRWETRLDAETEEALTAELGQLSAPESTVVALVLPRALPYRSFSAILRGVHRGRVPSVFLVARSVKYPAGALIDLAPSPALGRQNVGGIAITQDGFLVRDWKPGDRRPLGAGPNWSRAKARLPLSPNGAYDFAGLERQVQRIPGPRNPVFRWQVFGEDEVPLGELVATLDTISKAPSESLKIPVRFGRFVKKTRRSRYAKASRGL